MLGNLGVLKIKLKNWGFEKLNLKNEILGIYLKMESLKKLNLEIVIFEKLSWRLKWLKIQNFLKLILKKKIGEKVWA